jgi:hypothetical protein
MAPLPSLFSLRSHSTSSTPVQLASAPMPHLAISSAATLLAVNVRVLSAKAPMPPVSNVLMCLTVHPCYMALVINFRLEHRAFQLKTCPGMLVVLVTLLILSLISLSYGVLRRHSNFGNKAASLRWYAQRRFCSHWCILFLANCKCRNWCGSKLYAYASRSLGASPGHNGLVPVGSLSPKLLRRHRFW